MAILINIKYKEYFLSTCKIYSLIITFSIVYIPFKINTYNIMITVAMKEIQQHLFSYIFLDYGSNFVLLDIINRSVVARVME